MSRPLRLLIVEDSVPDTELLVREVRRGGYEPTYERVESPEAIRQALRQSWDLVIADHSVRQLDSLGDARLWKLSGEVVALEQHPRFPGGETAGR